MRLPQVSLDIGNVANDTVNVTRLCADVYRPNAWLQHLKMRNDEMPVVASQFASPFSPIQYHDEPRSMSTETLLNTAPSVGMLIDMSQAFLQVSLSAANSRSNCRLGKGTGIHPRYSSTSVSHEYNVFQGPAHVILCN